MSNPTARQQVQHSTVHRPVFVQILTVLYNLYTMFIVLPLFVLASILTALTTTVGCQLGNGHFWGYYPGKYWAWLTIRLLLLPVKVKGREHLDPRQSYVFVSNHQGAFDIFLIYGFLGRNFKWMMKKAIRKIPLIGLACEKAHHIYVDKSGASKIKKTYDTARETLREGMSLFSPKAHAASQDTWDGFAGEPSCLPMNCSCLSARSPSTALLMSCRVPVTGVSQYGTGSVLPFMNRFSQKERGRRLRNRQWKEHMMRSWPVSHPNTRDS